MERIERRYARVFRGEGTTRPWQRTGEHPGLRAVFIYPDIGPGPMKICLPVCLLVDGITLAGTPLAPQNFAGRQEEEA